MGVDTQLHVKARVTDAAHVQTLERRLTLLGRTKRFDEIDSVQQELEKHVTLPTSDDMPLFHLIPKVLVVNKGKGSLLLPAQMRQFYTKMEESPTMQLRAAKEATLAVVESARNRLGPRGVMVMPPSILLEDPEVRQKVLTPHMSMVEPYPEEQEDVSSFVLDADPTFVPWDQLDRDTYTVCKEMREMLQLCEFIAYWSKEGWSIEYLTELRGGLS